jgi:hypothetical protein
MEERMCVVCHDKPALFRCIQCHKPVCDDCAFKTEHGAFCGRPCAGAYRDFQQAQGRRGRVKSGGGLLKTLVVLIILAAIAVFAAIKLGIIKKDDIEQARQKVTDTVRNVTE